MQNSFLWMPLAIGIENENAANSMPPKSYGRLPPRAVNPNAFLPGTWIQPRKAFRKLRTIDRELEVAQQELDFLKTLAKEEDSDEYYEASLALPGPKTSESGCMPLYLHHIKPHMTAPLLDDSAPLDLSILLQEKGPSSVQAAAPMAHVWEFDPCNRDDECSLLHILSEELENLDIEDPKQSVWEILKEVTVGLNEIEYDKKYPWAKYVQDSEDD